MSERDILDVMQTRTADASWKVVFTKQEAEAAIAEIERLRAENAELLNQLAGIAAVRPDLVAGMEVQGD